LFLEINWRSRGARLSFFWSGGVPTKGHEGSLRGGDFFTARFAGDRGERRDWGEELEPRMARITRIGGEVKRRRGEMAKVGVENLLYFFPVSACSAVNIFV
jgi:hypothetical protein